VLHPEIARSFRTLTATKSTAWGAVAWDSASLLCT
jgi:hypothetical protein